MNKYKYVQHGMGIPSVGILLHEIIKLMYHARAKDPVFFRIGTCGGVGLDGGQVVITEEAVDGALNNHLDLVSTIQTLYLYLFFEQITRMSIYFMQLVLGKSVKRPSKLDRRVVKELKALADPEDPYDTVSGKTMCTYDFYEGDKYFQ